MDFFNSQTHRLEKFEPIEAGKVGLYTCGPTVYNYAHIGNLRTYIFEDVLRRTLQTFGYQVKHVMNITDVGHLESNADVGQDKMTLASEREKKTPWEVAKYFELNFFKDCAALNIIYPDVVCRATEHIPDMIEFVSALIDCDLAYVVDGNVYYDTTKFKTYQHFAGVDLSCSRNHNRVEEDGRKHNQNDFVLWFSQSKYPNQVMKWESPWGVGFPGWHIECSAMASKHLGKRIDIHCGGIDHIPIHHANEIAQSEGRFGHKWVNYWLHADFLLIDKNKMAKSGEFIRMETLIDRDFDPLAFRYLCLTTHYRGQLNFSYESLESAQNTLNTLNHKIDDWNNLSKTLLENDQIILDLLYRTKFNEAMEDDLDTPVALSVLWEALRDERLSETGKYIFFYEVNKIFGLTKNKVKCQMNAEQLQVFEERVQARKNQDWKLADVLREKLDGLGIALKDRPDGTDWYYKN